MKLVRFSIKEAFKAKAWLSYKYPIGFNTSLYSNEGHEIENSMKEQPLDVASESIIKYFKSSMENLINIINYIIEQIFPIRGVEPAHVSINGFSVLNEPLQKKEYTIIGSDLNKKQHIQENAWRKKSYVYESPEICLDMRRPLNIAMVGNLPKSINYVQFHHKPNERLNSLHQNGALCVEAESLLEAGFWEYSLETQSFFCSDNFFRVLNISSSTPLTGLESLLPYLAETDQHTLVDAWNQLVQEGKELSCMVRMPQETSEKWLKFKGKTIIKNNAVVKLVGAVQDVTLYVREINELKAERVKAEQIAQMKGEYVSYMSHEIRTPLNAIMGMTYILMQDETLGEECRDTLNSIHFSSQGLLTLVNNTLDYAKLEAGKVELEKVNFDLRDLLRNTHQALGLRAKEKSLNFEIAIDPQTPTEIAGDPVRLMQILNNLLSNGIKFTEKGFVKLGVEVVYQTSKEWVLDFCVSDSGIGIPFEKQNLIFESFEQANTSTHRKYGGTGLGLAITKNIVDIYKGTIQVTSQPGEGSLFNVRLRFTRPNIELPTLPKAFESKVSCSKMRGVKVLVVDDNIMNRTVATKLLSCWNIDVDTAEDGVIALEKIKTQTYDLVLMDLYMPVLDGFETIAKIKETGLDVPVIALTANTSESERKRILELGVQDYLTKPFVPEDLYNKLQYHLELSKTLV